MLKSVLALPLALALVLLSPAAVGNDTISVRQAHDKALRGEILLVDIRSPEEWRDTGVGEGAHAISMHRPDFMARIDAMTGGDRTRPVALICARGGRSASMQRALAERGYGRVLDVAEGMLGSSHGPGWLKEGLPIAPPAD